MNKPLKGDNPKSENSPTERESEAQYRTLVENAPLGIAVHRDGKLLFGNKAALRIMAYRISALLSIPLLFVWLPLGIQAVVALLLAIAHYYIFSPVTGPLVQGWASLFEVDAVKERGLSLEKSSFTPRAGAGLGLIDS